MLTFDIDALGNAPLLGGWDKKDGTAAEFKSSDSNYRVYKPTVTLTSDGGLRILTKLDHIRGGAADDHIALELVFDHLGRAVDGSVSLQFGSNLVLPTKALTQLGSALGGPKVGAIVAASSEVFNLLSDKLTQDSGGRQLFPSIARSITDLLGLYVGAGDDQLTGGASTDWIEGGRGNDVLNGGGGNDTLFGGLQNDKFDAATLERYGLGGGDGNDTLYGGEGDDRLVAGIGTDILNGGEGIDTLDLSSLSLTGHTVNVSLEPGGKLVTYRGGSASLSGIENVVGSADADSIKGSSDVNRLEGRSGNDILFGYGDKDTLLGGEGADQLDGGQGDDVLQGDLGDDTLTGGAGNDSLDGGSGFDTAIFSGARSNYRLIENSNGSITVTDLRVGSPDGVDTIRSIELVKFADGSIGTEAALNNAPTLSLSPQSNMLVEAGVSATGTPVAGISTATIALTRADPDANDTVSFDTTVWKAVPGQAGKVSQLGKYGSFVLDTSTGILTFTLDNADPDTNALGAGAVVDAGVYVTVKDAAGLSVRTAVMFTITGTADSTAPVFVATGTLDRPTLASTALDGTKGNGDSFAPVIFGNGTKVAFSSLASNLVSNDTNNATDIFIKDLATGGITRVSTTADGGQTNGNSYGFVLSRDATKMAFMSYANNLVANDTNGRTDVFVKDLITGEITRVSTASNGTQANGFGSYDPAFSPDGTKVVFVSDARNLVAGDNNVTEDIFVKDLATGAVTTVSAAANGTLGNNTSRDYVLSPDGTKVAFISYANNLVAGDTNGTADIFVKDLVTGSIARISVAADGTEGDGDSFKPAFSADGMKVAFWSYSRQLVADDTNNNLDLFISDLATRTITRVSGGQGAQGSNYEGTSKAVFSSDGTKIAFWSFADDLVAGDTNEMADIFVKDLVTGAITLVATGSEGGDGADVWWATEPAFSADFAKLAFTSDASYLVAGDTNNSADVFVKPFKVLTAATTGAVTDNGSKASVSTSGKLFFTDSVISETHAVSVKPAAGSIGTLTPVLTKDTTDGGNGVIDWIYTVTHGAAASLKAGATKVDTFTVAVTDDLGGTASQTVKVTVTGVNDAPTLAVGAQSRTLMEAGVTAAGMVTPGVATATIWLTRADIDTGDTTAFDLKGWKAVAGQSGKVSKIGTYGSAVLDKATGILTYTLDDSRPATKALAAGASTKDLFGVTIKDAAGATVTKTASFAITGSGDLPTAGVTLTGTSGADKFSPTATMIALRTTAFADTIKGLAGNDTIDGGKGNDKMYGGLGNDIYKVSEIGDKAYESSNSGYDTVESSVSYSLVGQYIETIILTGKNAINAIGNGLDNVLIGNSGNNLLNGASGIDTVDWSVATSALKITLDSKGNGKVTGVGIGTDTFTSIENAIGGKAGDTIVGNALANRIYGGNGDDKLYGGLGKDFLTGGAGADKFFFNTKLGSGNVDTIDDFAVKVDQVILDDDFFTKAGPTGDLSNGAFYIGTRAHDGTDRIIYDNKSGALFYDADGSGVGSAVQFAWLDAGLKLTSNDFEIIT